jgi:hypothetical protein
LPTAVRCRMRSRPILALCPPEVSGRDAGPLTEMTRQVALVGSPQSLHSRGEIGGARRSVPRRSLSRGSKTADPSPLVGAERLLIRFPQKHQESPPNPSRRHLADRGMIAPSDQEPSKAVQPRLARSRRSGTASLASEGMSMVSSGARHKIGAALARPTAPAGKVQPSTRRLRTDRRHRPNVPMPQMRRLHWL